jgi:hypothetical protein
MFPSKRTIGVFVMLVLLAAAALFSAGTAVAQGADGVLINYAEGTPDDRGEFLQLSVFFNLVDPQGQIVGGFEPTGANLTLRPEDGGTVPATVSEAKGGITLTLVLDVSGSMEQQLPRMKTAAQALVDGMPNETKFTLISFAGKESIITHTTLNEDKNFVKDQIQKLRIAAATCLFDAAYKGVDSLIGTTTGRRAVVLFTDGRDSNPTGTGICSDRTIDEVITKAKDPRFVVPIYTIGFGRPQDVDVESLTRMALETRGISSLGTDMNAVFNRINVALTSQYVAEALVQPKEGLRDIVALTVKLPGNVTIAKPGTGFFISPKDFTLRPTATISPTATLPPLTVRVDTIAQNDETKELTVAITVSDPGQVKEYRFDVEDENGIVKKSVVVGAPLTGPVPISIADLPGGQYRVRVTAIPSAGLPVSGDKQIAIVQTATPTASPTETPIASATEIPFSMEITGVRYEDQTTRTAILVDVRYVAVSKVATLQGQLFDNQKLSVQQYASLPIQDVVPIDLGSLPGGNYTVELTALDAGGTPLARIQREFTHTPPPTLTVTPSATSTPVPTETASPTPTLTPTAVVPTLAITSLSVDFLVGKFIILLQTQNEALFSKYEARLFDSNNIEVFKRDLPVPPYDKIELDTAGVAPGEYTLEVVAIGQDGARLVTASNRFKFFPPTATPSLTPTPTTLIGIFEEGFRNEQTRPIAIGIVAAIGLVLAGAVFMLTRRPKKPATGTGFLAEMTGAISIEQMKQMQAQQGGRAAPTTPAKSVAATKPAQAKSAPPAAPKQAINETAMDIDKTSPVPFGMVPVVQLVVEESRDKSVVGKVVVMDHFPFTLGRKQRDFNIDGDDNVSRNHAEITQKGTQYFIIDNNSTHHTFIDDQQVPAGVATPLYNGAVIRLGATTALRFSTQGSATTMDIDKTNPVSF